MTAILSPTARAGVQKPPKHPDLDPGDEGPEVEIVKALLRSQGYDVKPGPKFDAAMKATVASFQASHTGPDGKPLAAIGRVGQKTWWALYNPSGDAQRSYMVPTVQKPEKNGTPARTAFIKAAVEWWKHGTREIPDGSNWGDGVSDILKHAGGPRFWCCHFTSRCHKDAFGDYPYGVDHGHVATFANEAKKRGDFHAVGTYLPEPADLAVFLFRDGRGKLTGSGHICMVAAIEAPRRGQLRYNHIGGNEGNRVRLGLRSTADEGLAGFINLFGDADEDTEPGDYGLRFTPDASKADGSFAGTR